MDQQLYGAIHCHSEHSVKDSALKTRDLCVGAKEMGAVAVALTDHGTCTGLIEFLEAAEDVGIKGILGVEAYVNTKYNAHAHLLLLAKNYEGYQKIARAVTEANKHLVGIGGIMSPIMDKEIISEYLSGGDVIATSACITGVLSCILNSNKRTRESVEKLKQKQKKYNNPNDPAYVTNAKRLEELDISIENDMKTKEQLEILSSKKYTKRLSGLKSLEGTPAYETTKASIEKEMAESEVAQAELASIKERLANNRRSRTLLNNKCKEAQKSHQKYQDIEEQIKKLTDSILPQEALMEEAKKEVLWYKEVFLDNFYIEIQNHGMEEEAYVMPLLVNLARECNVPLIASNDVHMLKKEDAEARQFMRSLRFETWQEVTPSEEEVYLKPDLELYEALCKIVDVEAAKEAMRNIRIVCDECDIVFPKTSHYPKYRDENGKEVEDSANLLRQRAAEGIPKRFPHGFPDPSYVERANYELEVIINLGYADYLLIVADYINYAKKLCMENNEQQIGYGIGPARGSGAGCLVNYLLGITSLDPIKYGLLFERFLNVDRVSMPDIDTDFSNEVRDASIQYIREKYGEESVSAIHTRMRQNAKGSIRNSARVRGWELYPDNEERAKEIARKGTLLAKEIPNDPSATIEDWEDTILTKYPDSDTKIILERAKKVSGTMTGLSVHAAGIIIGDGQPLKNYVPLLYNTSKNQWAVQCDMNEGEHIGLLKMDFLGLRNLDIITECIRRVKKNTGKAINPEVLPFEEEVFSEIFAKGKTSCVFQFESAGMKQMLIEFQPKTFEDIILLVAAYRPGPMDFIPSMMKVKRKEEEPHYIIPVLEGILSATYGQVIYQEQLMEIFSQCAGFTRGEADIIRRYMSKKKIDKFVSYKPKFIAGLIKAGASEKDAEDFWDSLVDFSKYAFNKSHAAAYALVAYQTAYLKHHYPVEYMTSVLNHSEVEKIPALLHECKAMGIEVSPPDVNKSMVAFEDRADSILYGLGAIKGLKSNALPIIQSRQETGYYSSFKDFLYRGAKNTGVVEKVIKSGALDSLQEGSRDAMLHVMPQAIKLVDKLQKKEADLVSLMESYATSENKPKTKRAIDSTGEALERIKAQLGELSVSKSMTDNRLVMLQEEKELLGGYVSAHPLDSYASVFRSKSLTLIEDFQTGYREYAGMITNLRRANRKSDGREMAFFDLEDTTGTLPVACFVEAYGEYMELIREGNVIKVYGKGVEEESFYEDGEPVKQLVTKTVKLCKPEKSPIFISVPSMRDYEGWIYGKLLMFTSSTGYPVVVHDASTGLIVEKDLYLKSDVLETEIPNVTIKLLDYI